MKYLITANGKEEEILSREEIAERLRGKKWSLKEKDNNGKLLSTAHESVDSAEEILLHEIDRIGWHPERHLEITSENTEFTVKFKIEYGLLEQFCATMEEEPVKEWIRKPFLIGNYVCASNSYYMFLAHKNIVANIPEGIIRKNEKIMPALAENCKTTLDTDALKKLRDSAPMLDEELTSLVRTDCPECKGKGSVTAEYRAGSDGMTYDIECDCPVCDGSGAIEKETKTPTGRNTVDDSAILKIVSEDKSCFLKYIHFDKLLQMAEMLGTDSLTVTCIDSDRPFRATLCEGLEFIMTPFQEIGITPSYHIEDAKVFTILKL